MNDESVPLTLSLPRLEKDSGETVELYRELRKPLIRYLVCLGLSGDEAQDVVQDSFLSLQRHLASGGEQANIRGWLFRVAHNQARNRMARYERRFAEALDEESDSLRHEATPERAVLQKEKFQRVRDAMKTLSEPERECLLLRASGLRYREIAEAMGIATSTVGDTVGRAIKKLAEKCNV